MSEQWLKRIPIIRKSSVVCRRKALGWDDNPEDSYQYQIEPSEKEFEYIGWSELFDDTRSNKEEHESDTSWEQEFECEYLENQSTVYAYHDYQASPE